MNQNSVAVAPDRPAAAHSATDLSEMRETMIACQLRTMGVNDPALLAALAAVAREDYAPGVRPALAYVDIAIPLEAGRALNSPLATARLIAEAKVQRGDHVLLIGAATGYAAALLAALGATVIAVEQPELAAIAKANLKMRATVRIIAGALDLGSKKHGPYDVILIDGAVARVPDAVWAQLKTGGRLVSGLVQHGVTRLASGRKSAGGCGLVAFMDVACVPLPGFEQAKGFSF